MMNSAAAPVDHAKWLASFGLPVFPACFPVRGECGCGRGHSGRDAGKAPLTPHGFKDATTDSAEIERLWKIFPAANVAIATGGAFGLIVVDVDGVEGLQSVAGRHLPTTPTVRTPGNGGGTHYYFRMPDCQYSSAVRLLPGLDVRANGGYVIAPPSVHRNGQPYTWLIKPGDTPFSPPPSWLLELLRTQRERPEARLVHDTELLRSVAIACRALQELDDTRRDDYTHWLEVGMALSELGDIGLQLWDAWSRGSPKYEEGVCERKWRSFTPGAGVGIGSLIYWAREDREKRTAPKSVLEIERAVLGHAIAYPSSLPALVRDVTADMFVGPLHRPIWNAIVRLYSAGSAATVEAIEALVGDGALEEARINDLPSEACSEAALPGYLAVLEEQRAARAVREIGYEFARIADSRQNVIEQAQAVWNGFIARLPTTGNEMTLSELVGAAHTYSTRNEGFPSGIPELDEQTGQLEPGNLVFIYGWPGLGKTLMALAMARRQAAQDLKVGFISLEMAPGPLGLRVVTAESKQSRSYVDRLARNPVQDIDRVWDNVRAKASKLPIWFAFNVRDIDDLVRLGRRWKDVYGIQVLYVDHLQEITTKRGGDSSVQAMDYIVGCLKDLALKTNMVVITIAQFNRNYLFQLAEGKDLGFESIRGTSRIEQSADRILFLLPEKKETAAYSSTQKIVVRVKKNRNGRRGEVTVVFDYSKQDIMLEQSPYSREPREPWHSWGDGIEAGID